MVKRNIPLSTIQEKRREYVNNEFGRQVSGTHMSNLQKSRLFKKLWRQAKRKYK